MTTDPEATSAGVPPLGPPLQEAEFMEQIGYCIDAMIQDDSLGETLVFFRQDRRLHMRRVDRLELADLDRYEMILFDGGNTCGDLWKHVFFPRQRRHCFVYEAD